MTAAANDNATTTSTTKPKRTKLSSEERAAMEDEKQRKREEKEAAKAAREAERQAKREALQHKREHKASVDALMAPWKKWKALPKNVRSKQTEPRLPSTIECAILGIDPSKTNWSGWALYYRGRRIESGEVQCFERGAVAQVVRRCLDFARELGTTLALVTEMPPIHVPGGGRAVSQSVGRWVGGVQDADLFGDVWPGKPVHIEVPASQHRKFAMGYGGSNRDKARAAERQWADANGMADAGPDEIPAAMICEWASASPKVFNALPKEHQELSPEEVGALKAV